MRRVCLLGMMEGSRTEIFGWIQPRILSCSRRQISVSLPNVARTDERFCNRTKLSGQPDYRFGGARICIGFKSLNLEQYMPRNLFAKEIVSLNFWPLAKCNLCAG